jgi:hypothetical protein
MLLVSLCSSVSLYETRYESYATTGHSNSWDSRNNAVTSVQADGQKNRVYIPEFSLLHSV